MNKLQNYRYAVTATEYDANNKLIDDCVIELTHNTTGLDALGKFEYFTNLICEGKWYNSISEVKFVNVTLEVSVYEFDPENAIEMSSNDWDSDEWEYVDSMDVCNSKIDVRERKILSISPDTWTLNQLPVEQRDLLLPKLNEMVGELSD